VAESRDPTLGRWSLGLRAAAVLFAVYPLVALATSAPDALTIALVLLIDALFVAMILVGARVIAADRPALRGWPLVVMSLVLTVLVAVVATHDPETGWIALFYYASSSALVIRPAAVAARVMLIAGVVGGLTLFADGASPADSLVQGVSITVIGLVLLGAVEIRRTNVALMEAREELASLAVQEERDRIARDLHDILGHSLTVIALKSELARRLIPTDPDRAASEIGDVERVARESLASVRETVSGYRQPTLALELVGARTALAAAGIEGRVEPAPDGLPPAVDAVLAWAVREGVTNVVRHSGAERAEIRVERSASAAEVEVIDDGYPPASGQTSDGSPARNDGTGLAGLRERVTGIGGRIEAAPLPERGFRLRVTVPIEAS
jgi:two-component system, NarL family, sensor histidine kinase DesK